jgi:hypothetical protein
LKLDLPGLALRWAAAWLLLSFTATFLYLAGSSQSFLEPTLAQLFQAVRWLVWGGFLASWLLVLPLTIRHPRQVWATVAVGLGFGVIFLFVLLWGSWVYPDAGPAPW